MQDAELNYLPGSTAFYFLNPTQSLFRQLYCKSVKGPESIFLTVLHHGLSAFPSENVFSNIEHTQGKWEFTKTNIEICKNSSWSPAYSANPQITDSQDIMKQRKWLVRAGSE